MVRLYKAERWPRGNPECFKWGEIMKEKEVIIPIRFPVIIGKTRVMLGGGLGASISMKTKWPIVMAYFYLAFKVLIMGIRRTFAA